MHEKVCQRLKSKILLKCAMMENQNPQHMVQAVLDEVDPDGYRGLTGTQLQQGFLKLGIDMSLYDAHTLTDHSSDSGGGFTTLREFCDKLQLSARESTGRKSSTNDVRSESFAKATVAIRMVNAFMRRHDLCVDDLIGTMTRDSMGHLDRTEFQDMLRDVHISNIFQREAPSLTRLLLVNNTKGRRRCLDKIDTQKIYTVL
jgi:hypothetical protein